MIQGAAFKVGYFNFLLHKKLTLAIQRKNNETEQTQMYDWNIGKNLYRFKFILKWFLCISG